MGFERDGTGKNRVVTQIQIEHANELSQLSKYYKPYIFTLLQDVFSVGF